MNDLFANFFEIWGTWLSPISTELYDYNIFVTLGFIWFFVVLGAVVGYYYIWNSPKYNKRRIWSLYGLGTAVVVAAIAFFYTNASLRSAGVLYEDTATVGLIDIVVRMGVFSVFAFILFSLLLKRWSGNCSRIPF